nr:serine/arginine repetitive matrix protein 1 [Drosophila takahashii]
MANPNLQFSRKYLTIQNDTKGLSTSTDSNEISLKQSGGAKLKESVSFTGFGSHFVGLTLIPERIKRVSGGDCDYNILRNPLVVRSGEIPDQDQGECVPSCPYRNYQGQNNYQQPANQNYQRSVPAQNQNGYYDNSQPHQDYASPGNQCYVPPGRTQSQSKDRSGSDCGCDPPTCRRAYRTPSSHYMEYREFQQSPRKNPALDRTQYDDYPQETQRSNRLQRKVSECGCERGSPQRRQVQRTSRLQKKVSECSCESESSEGKQPVQRNNRLQRRSSECSCAAGSSPKRQSVQRRSPPDKSYYMRKPTQAAQTCSVRCHARSHVVQETTPPPPAPKRRCPAATPPPTSKKPTPRTKSAISSKRGNRRKCSACNRCSDDESGEPSDYVEGSRSRTEVLRNPLVQSRSSYDSYSEEYPVQRRTRCSSCRKTNPENRSSVRKGPPLCSNETLMEKPVQSYRFNCPENGKCASCRKLCPKCNKVMPQKQKNASAKRYVSSVARKCCPMCGLLPMMPNISIPDVASSNRILYKTLGRCRPRKVPKARYELTICCKKRCQGGRNSHYMTSTIATSLKRRAKAAMIGGNPVAPSRMSSHRQGLHQYFSPAQNERSHSQPTGQTRSQSRSGPSHSDQERSSPSTSGQQRERPAATPQFKMRSPSANLVQKTEKRQIEREVNPRTRAVSPIIEIHSSSGHRETYRGTSHSYSHRSEPEPSTSHRTQHEPAPSNRSRPDPPEIPPAYLAPASMEPEVSSEPIRRGASYLGTEVNPFYRGSFLRVRCSRDSSENRLSPIHQRGEKIVDMPKPRKVAGMGLPLKYTRLSQLQAWVFGDPFVKGNDHLGTWSWRQIFGRNKKRSAAKSNPAKTIEANT